MSGAERMTFATAAGSELPLSAQAAPNGALTRHVAAILRAGSIPAGIARELDIHPILAEMLRAAGCVVEREVVIGPGCRADILVRRADGIGAGGAVVVEVKRRGAKEAEVAAQAVRYARYCAGVVVAAPGHLCGTAIDDDHPMPIEWVRLRERGPEGRRAIRRQVAL